MSDTNSPGAGHNEAPDYAQTITAALERDYEELTLGAQALLAEAAALPKNIPDGDDSLLNDFTTLIKRMRDTTSRIETFRTTEKEPHLRAGQAVDGFFNRLFEKMSRRNAKDKPGAADILQARVGDFLNRKEAAERAERERLAKIEWDKAEAIRRQEEEASRAAAEAAAKAARARNAEMIAAHEAEAKRQREIAEQARADQLRADQQAEDARIDAKAKPADLARTRTEGGAVATLQQVPFVQIDDVMLLDMNLLRPYFKEEHVLQAVKTWAKVTGHKKQMAGATIELRNQGVVR